MTLKRPKVLWFAAFTVVFAVCAAFVFWGTWSTAVAPVMPDCPTSHPSNWVHAWLVGWMNSGKFVPGDLRWFLGSPYFWQELQYALALYCAGLGLAYFLRGRGLARPAAYGAGLLLAFCGYWSTLFSAGHLGWFQWMTYGVFAFGLVDRAFAKGRARHWLLLGATVAWGSFYQPDLWLLFTVFTAAYFVFRWTAARTFPWKGMLLALAAFALIGLPSFCAAIGSDLAGRDQQIAEGQTVGGAARDDAEKRWIFVTNWSLPPAETAEFFRARVNGDTSCPLTLALGGRATGVRPYTGALGRPYGASAGNYRQHSLYVGWVTCLLALVGAVLAFPARRRDVLFFAAAAVVFWLFSMGRHCAVVYRVVYALPFGDYLRAPVKWHHLTEFCLVVLAGFGADALWRRSRETWQRALVAAVLLWGVVDLARVDRLYCAPQPVDHQVQLAPAQQVASPEARRYLAQQGVRVLGSANGIAAVGRRQAPARSQEPLPPFGLAAALGALSAAATLSVLAFALYSACRREPGTRQPDLV